MAKKILLVEDDVLVLKALERLLTRQGYSVTKARNGKEALEVMASATYDLVISDIRMPNLSGVEFVEQVRRNERTRGCQTPIILITGYASEDAPIDAVKLGVVDYVLKPFNNDELLSAIERGLEKSSRGVVDLAFTISQMKNLVHQYYGAHEEEICGNKDAKEFFERMGKLIFEMEKSAISQP